MLAVYNGTNSYMSVARIEWSFQVGDVSPIIEVQGPDRALDAYGRGKVPISFRFDAAKSADIVKEIDGGRTAYVLRGKMTVYTSAGWFDGTFERRGGVVTTSETAGRRNGVTAVSERYHARGG